MEVVNVTIIVLGEKDVGKTSLLRRFVENTFTASSPKRFVHKYKKVIEIENDTIEITLWDTAGDEVYYNLLVNYYIKVDGLLLVYDVQNPNTFAALSKWLKYFKSVNKTAEVLIAGNKAEDESKNLVNVADVESFIREEQLTSIEVSAKYNKNVKSLFHHIVQKILIAKGIVPYCSDIQPKDLESSQDYISPSSISPESSKIIDTSSAINSPIINESSVIYVKSLEQRTATTFNTSNTQESSWIEPIKQDVPNAINTCSTEKCLVTDVESNEQLFPRKMKAPNTTEYLSTCTESSENYNFRTINQPNKTNIFSSSWNSTELYLNTSKSASNTKTNRSFMENEIYNLEDDEDSYSNKFGILHISMDDNLSSASNEDSQSTHCAENTEVRLNEDENSSEDCEFVFLSKEDLTTEELLAAMRINSPFFRSKSLWRKMRKKKR